MTDFKKDLRQSGISLFFSAIRYCISLSWRTSKYYHILLPSEALAKNEVLTINSLSGIVFDLPRLVFSTAIS